MKVSGPFTFEEANGLCVRYASLNGIEDYRKGVFRHAVSWILPAPYEENELIAYVNYAYFPDADAGATMEEALREFRPDEYDVLVFMDYDDAEYLFKYIRLHEFLLQHPERLLPGDTI